MMFSTSRRGLSRYMGPEFGTEFAGLGRNRLQPILTEIKEHFHDYLLTPDLIELRNIAVIAELIVRSATLRQESRGLHYLADSPSRNDRVFQHDTVLEKTK